MLGFGNDTYGFNMQFSAYGPSWVSKSGRASFRKTRRMILPLLAATKDMSGALPNATGPWNGIFS